MTEISIHEVAPDVFAMDNRWVDGKTGLVLGSEYVLAIDANAHDDETQAMMDWLAARGREVSLVAYTHGHGDHVRGAEPLSHQVPRPIGIAHTLALETMQEPLEEIVFHHKVTPEEARHDLIWPVVTFSEELMLHLGNKTLRLMHTPGHSVDSISLFIEEDGVLFAGDTVVTAIVPSITHGSSHQLEASLRRLAELDAQILVPGHGRVVTGQEEVRSWLAGWADYIANVREGVRESVEREVPMEQIIDAVPFDRLVGNRVPPVEHDNIKRHGTLVHKVAGEVLKGRADDLRRQSQAGRVANA